MKVKILLFLCIMILILSSCGAKEADNIATPDFPVDPDKILVGAVVTDIQGENHHKYPVKGLAAVAEEHSDELSYKRHEKCYSKGA